MKKNIFSREPKRYRKRDRKKRLIATFVLVVLAGAGVAYFTGQPAEEPIQTPPVQKVPGHISDRPVEINKDDPSKGYVIDVAYPVVGNLPQIARGKINSSIEKTADTFMRDFADNVILLAVSPAALDEESTLNVTYVVKQPVHGIVGVVFELEEYVRGAAHPNTRIVTKNYSITTGDEIALKDLFKEGAHYLSLVGGLATEQLNALFRQEGIGDWFREGARGTIENYDRFYLVNEGLVIVFDPYQVAPYARGTVTVTIPFADIASSLVSQ